MNEPIISPLYFYIADVLSDLCFVAVLSLVFLGLFITVVGLISFLEHETEKLEKLKKAVCIWIVIAIIGIVLPSRTAFYQMMIANTITKANMETTEEVVDKALGKIVEKILEASDKWEQRKK